MDTTSIFRLCSDPVVRLAARELRRVLKAASGLDLPIRGRRKFDPADGPAFWLGLFGDFPGEIPDGFSEDPVQDAVVICTGVDRGIIAGANPRSVLLAVYRYLTELGCRWVRPGKSGEHVPRLGPALPDVDVVEKASYRHRGVCIEGAVSYEHVRDMVDWLPKLGFNAYFIQFREAHEFFRRWYEHDGNPRMESRPLAREDSAEMTRKIRAEVKKRGLLLHMVGHGWTCEPFGIPGTGWSQQDNPLDDQTRQCLAEIDGKRDLWHGVAINTNLCYGNDKVREIITDAIVEYAGHNPDVDVIHFWLADGTNNHCECPLCRDHRPSDLYVKMLNELDAKMTVAGLDTRIVFLLYVDLLWPPLREQIANPDRFILMFAPITRSYLTSFTAAGGSAELAPFERNKMVFPTEPAGNAAYLSAWQEGFEGDSFDFDYHYMWHHYHDPSEVALARVLHEDIRGLRDIGLDGLMSCQVQRAFFPTGLGMCVMGRTLWNRDLSFDEIADDHFRAAFGDCGQQVRGCLQTISDLFAPSVPADQWGDRKERSPGEGLERIKPALRELRSLIRRGKSADDPCRAKSWRYLQCHAEICRRLSDALRTLYAGQKEQAAQQAWDLFDWLRRRERTLHPVLDVLLFQNVVAQRFEITREQLRERT